MPIHAGKDDKGCYYQWGSHGRKYYYQCGEKKSQATARKKAGKQGQAAHAAGYKGE